MRKKDQSKGLLLLLVVLATRTRWIWKESTDFFEPIIYEWVLQDLIRNLMHRYMGKGAVMSQEKISSAIEQVDSSSGAIGTAIGKAIKTGRLSRTFERDIPFFHVLPYRGPAQANAPACLGLVPIAFTQDLEQGLTGEPFP